MKYVIIIALIFILTILILTFVKVPNDYFYITKKKNKNIYHYKFLFTFKKNKIRKLYIKNVGFDVHYKYDFINYNNEKCAIFINGNICTYVAQDDEYFLNLADEIFSNSSCKDMQSYIKNFINNNLENILENIIFEENLRESYCDMKRLQHAFMIQLLFTLSEIGLRPSLKTNIVINMAIQNTKTIDELIENGYTDKQINQILKAYEEGLNLFNISKETSIAEMRMLRKKHLGIK